MRKLSRFLLLLFAAHAPILSAERPNIILIMADDLGYEGLSCYGSASYQTPHLDKLAANGIRFNHCYSQPICTPSRVQIMTGRYNHRNYQGFGYLDPSEITFGTLMKQAGYATCISGKWQLNGIEEEHPGYDDPQRPLALGFDSHCLWQLTKHRRDGERFANPLVYLDGKALPRDPDLYGPDLFRDHVLDFIEAKKDQPFFIYFPMALVHNPFVPTPATPEWKNPENRYKKDNRHFADMISYMDDIVGRIVQKLDTLKLTDNTLILFTGDNGTNTAIESRMQDGSVIKGDKGETTDGGTRVPLIAHWPAAAPKGLVSDDLIDFSDMLPTIVSAAGGKIPSDRKIDGHSFLPLLAQDENWKPRDWVFCHYWGEKGRAKEGTREFIRDQRWKLYADGRFYDIKHDPLEDNPIASPSKKAAKRKKYLQNAYNSLKR
ncbi:MAG: sulfatase-like hydrolase/transferase [Verrucomicrobiota bacterium]